MTIQSTSESFESQQIKVQAWLFGGQGLARRSDGAVVMIPGGIPGDCYEVNSFRKERGVLWADQATRLVASDMRINAPCPHAEGCGGCHFQHVSRVHETSLKVEALRDSLSRIAQIKEAEVQVHDYDLAHSRSRGELRVDANGLGLFSVKSHRVEPLSNCLVVPRVLQDMWPLLKAMVKDISFIGSIAYAAHLDCLILEFKTRSRRHPISEKGWLTFKAAGLAGLVVRAANGKIINQWGARSCTAEWNGVSVELTTTQFFQSNPASWADFFERVMQWKETLGPGPVWDVHAGSGFFVSCLLELKVIATEPDMKAVKLLKKSFQSRCPELSIYPGMAETWLMADENQPTLKSLAGCILDPPRSGLSRTLSAELRDRGPEKMLMFSCDPATFARDLNRLSDSYQIHGAFHLLNVNPATARFEVAVELVRP